MNEVSSFGTFFKISVDGCSHDPFYTLCIKGIPKGTYINIEDIKKDLERRRPKSFYMSPRKEEDRFDYSNIDEKGYVCKDEIFFKIYNNDINKKDYSNIVDENGDSFCFRPSHSDYPYFIKYGNLKTGGGISSARETVTRVVAGSVAKQVLVQYINNYSIVSFVESILDQSFFNIENEKDYDDKLVYLNSIDKDYVINNSGFLDSKYKKKVEELLLTVKENKDSAGGVIGTLIKGVPAGIGDPIFLKLDSLLGGAILSIPGSKGIEIGAGSLSSLLSSSHNNDEYYLKDGVVCCYTNRSGGIIGGVSSGENIYFRSFFKPPSSIERPQKTVSWNSGKFYQDKIEIKGRHDTCYVPRACVIVESMASIVILDSYLRNKNR